MFDQVIQIVVVFGADVLGHQAPIDDAAFDDRLKHGEDVACDLRFVGDQAIRGMQDSGIDLPACAGFQPVGAGVKQDSVVAFVPVFETAPDIVLGGAGFETHEGVGEIVLGEVVLRREVVGFRFPALAHQLGLGVALVHVMRDGPHVVEEFAEEIPSALALDHIGAEEEVARVLDGVF
jgi:hypothetical protein